MGMRAQPVRLVHVERSQLDQRCVTQARESLEYLGRGGPAAPRLPAVRDVGAVAEPAAQTLLRAPAAQCAQEVGCERLGVDRMHDSHFIARIETMKRAIRALRLPPTR